MLSWLSSYNFVFLAGPLMTSPGIIRSEDEMIFRRVSLMIDNTVVNEKTDT